MSRIDTQIDIPIDAPVDKAHRQSVGAGIADIARFLQDLLGQRLVADMTGSKNPKLVGSWARGQHLPRAHAESALRAAYQVAQLILQHDSEHVARAWFIGMNPQLDGESPATAIKEGRTREVWIAAKAYVAGG
jgi:hypothetical protein